MPAARKNISRSYELELIAKSFFEKNYKQFIGSLKKNPTGAIFEHDGKQFEYGKIERLVSFIGTSEVSQALKIDGIKDIFHFDSLSADRKKEIIKHSELSLEEAKKIDIYLSSVNNEYGISVKDSSQVCKLAQKSKPVDFAGVSLNGGLNDRISRLIEGSEIPESIDYTTTGLRKDQFSKLSQHDEKLAWFKKNQPDRWNLETDNALSNAYLQLRNLASEINKGNKSVLISLLGIMLSGVNMPCRQFCIWLEPKLLSVKEFIDNINHEENLPMEAYLHNTPKKSSLIINIEYKGVLYSLTKIEPSFEGGGVDVSQTKGIIFHFQQFQHPDTNFSIWNLISSAGSDLQSH
jgi:hypothetical protein